MDRGGNFGHSMETGSKKHETGERQGQDKRAFIDTTLEESRKRKLRGTAFCIEPGGTRDGAAGQLLVARFERGVIVENNGRIIIPGQETEQDPFPYVLGM